MAKVIWNKTPFWRLMAALLPGVGLAIAAQVLLFFGLIQFKLMGMVGEENVTEVFGIAAGVSCLVIALISPLTGLLADHTYVSMGRRRFWIVAGSFGGFAVMQLLAYAQNQLVLVTAWCLAQIFYGLVALSYYAMIPEQVEAERFGRASGIMSVAGPLFVMLGTVLMGVFADTPVEDKIVTVAVVQLIFGGLSALIVKDTAVTAADFSGEKKGMGFSWKNFYPSFRKYPAYTWALLTKLFIYLTNAGLTMLTLFYVTRFHLSETEVFAIGSYTGASIMLTVVAGLLGGFLSDKLKRQKPFVMGAALVTGVCLVVFAFSGNVWTVVAGYFVFNFGFGLYSAVDNALVNRILPSRENAGKDIAIMNITTNVSSSLVTFVAPMLIGLGSALMGDDGYTLFFLVLSLCAIFSFLAVIPIPEVGEQEREEVHKAAEVVL